MTVRRLVVGNRDGRSAVLSDITAKKGPIGNQDFLYISPPHWRSEEPPVVPNDATFSEIEEGFPPAGGLWVMKWKVPPGSTLAEGDGPVTFDGDRPGFHRTDSVDIGLVLSGSITIELDDEDAVLHTGDAIVINGVDHAWRNDGDETAVVISFLVGATRIEKA